MRSSAWAPPRWRPLSARPIEQKLARDAAPPQVDGEIEGARSAASSSPAGPAFRQILRNRPCRRSSSPMRTPDGSSDQRGTLSSSRVPSNRPPATRTSAEAPKADGRGALSSARRRRPCGRRRRAQRAGRSRATWRRPARRRPARAQRTALRAPPRRMSTGRERGRRPRAAPPQGRSPGRARAPGCRSPRAGPRGQKVRGPLPARARGPVRLSPETAAGLMASRCPVPFVSLPERGPPQLRGCQSPGIARRSPPTSGVHGCSPSRSEARRCSPIPSTSFSWSRLAIPPWASRYSMIRSKVGPIPSSSSSSSAVAREAQLDARAADAGRVGRASRVPPERSPGDPARDGHHHLLPVGHPSREVDRRELRARQWSARPLQRLRNARVRSEAVQAGSSHRARHVDEHAVARSRSPDPAGRAPALGPPPSSFTGGGAAPPPRPAAGPPRGSQAPAATTQMKIVPVNLRAPGDGLKTRVTRGCRV